MQMLNGFHHSRVRSRLAAVLANAVVLLDGTYEMTSFKPVMGARLFDVHVLPGLARPDGHKRVPMIGRGDGNGVNVFVFEQLAHIHIGFWLWHSELLHVSDALVQDGFIHVAQSGSVRPGDTGKAMAVILAATSHSTHRHAHTITSAYDPGVAGSRDAQSSAGDTCAGDFQEIPPRSL